MKYGGEIILPRYNYNEILFNQAYLSLTVRKFYFRIGKKSNPYKLNNLSSGSLVESSNASPMPKISTGLKDYQDIRLFKFNFQYLASIAHGWLKSTDYITNPFLHQKSISIKKKISENSNIELGLDHMAIWAGETKQFGKLPSSSKDFIRIIFALPGDKNSTSQEQKNSLGNHLGAWNYSYEKKYKDKKIKFYGEHPFEDESGARWLLNGFDGLYGININYDQPGLISCLTYEYINTMNQSGAEGSSDTTYGWDNYYNHYIYQSGWTNNRRVIGNPLFTLGSNKGRYSDGQYIVNNRLRAHHFGLQGSISKKFHYKILFTYSENFGIYPDEDFFKSKNKVYRFNGGLIQRSGMVELSIKNLFNKINASLVYGIDNGELLYKTDSFMLKINHKFDI